MKVLISHPTSNEFNRAAALGLLEANQLLKFHTAIASFPGSLIDRLSEVKPLSELKRRRFSAALQPLTQTSPWLEAGRQLAMKAGWRRLVQHETGIFCVDAVYRGLDKKVAADLSSCQILGATAVYAYLDGAIHSFRKAKSLGMQCLYDLPIGYWRTAKRMLSAEQERWPAWATTMTGLMDSEEKLARQDEELALADHVIVASRFTASTLIDYPGQLPLVSIVPYGFPEVTKTISAGSAYSGNRKLRLLFVGGLSQRKGIADVFEAIKGLENFVELTIVGLKSGPACSALDEALSLHNWIPSLPHHQVLALMGTQDVLLFPSVFEGFGLVITEAMSQGIPVITTDRTAGPDLITSGEDGWLINAGDTQSLKTAIEDLLCHPAEVASAAKAAKETARKRPWSVYKKELINVLNKPFDGKTR